jgi:hypothetical protein
MFGARWSRVPSRELNAKYKGELDTVVSFLDQAGTSNSRLEKDMDEFRRQETFS